MPDHTQRAKARPPSNPRVVALFQDAVATVTGKRRLEDFLDLTGLSRGTGGPLWRGEVQRIAPDQANLLVNRLPISMFELLDSFGFNVKPTPAERIPAQLVEAWPRLRPHVQRSLLTLVLERSSEDPDEGERGRP